MAVVRCPCRERRSIIEYIRWQVFRELELAVEGIYVVPLAKHSLFFSREID